MTEKISFQVIYASWQQMLEIDKNAIFTTKVVYLYNPWY